jgi:hypothetical protein
LPYLWSQLQEVSDQVCPGQLKPIHAVWIPGRKKKKKVAMMNAIDREKNRIWLTPCVSLIIFIQHTGDIGDRRDSGQLKNEKKNNISNRHLGL